MHINELIQTFHKNKQPNKAIHMEKYMRNQFSFLGLQAGERRTLAKDFITKKTTEAKESGIDWPLIFQLWELPEREFQLTGLDYLKRVEKSLVLEDLTNLRTLVLTKSWWDTVDFLAKNIGQLVLKEPSLIGEMKTWSVEENIWIRRSAILHQLAFKNLTNSKLLAEIIVNNLHDNEFFIQKAIGWALREYAKTNEAWVKEFISKNQENMSKLSIREATKNLASK